MYKRLKYVLILVLFSVVSFAVPRLAYAVVFDVFDVTVVLDQYFYDSSNPSYPHYYHYTVINSSDSAHAISHWSLFIPCMHSGSTDLTSIHDPEGFTHEAPLFEEIYYGIKWEDISGDDLEPLEPGESVSCFGFYSRLPKGTVEWESKGGQLFDSGTVEGPQHGATPEPTTLSILGLGLLGLAGFKRRRG